MEIPSEILDQGALNTRPKIEEELLIVLDKSIYEDHLSQPLQTNKKQLKTPVRCLFGHNGIFIVTNKNNNFYFTVSISDDEFNLITILNGICEIESLNNQIKRNIIEEGYCTEANYPILFQTNF